MDTLLIVKWVTDWGDASKLPLTSVGVFLVSIVIDLTKPTCHRSRGPGKSRVEDHLIKYSIADRLGDNGTESQGGL